MQKLSAHQIDLPASFYESLDAYPIKISAMEAIIERVHKQYPFVTKSEITFITKIFFEVIRDKLFRGEIINVKSLFRKTKLIVFYKKDATDKMVLAVKIKTTIPKELK